MSRPAIDGNEFLQALSSSPLLLDYQTAFLSTTGLRLLIEGPESEKKSATFPFEVLLVVPVQVGGRTVANLRIQGLVKKGESIPSWSEYQHMMVEQGSHSESIDAARHRYAQLTEISPETLSGFQTMLGLFASQLADYADKLFLQHSFAEPLAVQKAKDFILRHLNTPLTLDNVAEHAGVSIFHFCKIFKKATGLTFIEFVNRARVEQAKRLLMRPNSRITEIAYDVGFQSLSQFNRSFRRVVSVSPTEYRSGMARRFLTRSKNLVKLS